MKMLCAQCYFIVQLVQSHAIEVHFKIRCGRRECILRTPHLISVLNWHTGARLLFTFRHCHHFLHLFLLQISISGAAVSLWIWHVSCTAIPWYGNPAEQCRSRGSMENTALVSLRRWMKGKINRDMGQKNGSLKSSLGEVQNSFHFYAEKSRKSHIECQLSN